LIRRLRTEGLLGRQAGLSDEELAQKMVKRNLFESIVTLHSNEKRVIDVIRTEWAAFANDADSRSIYAAIALAHNCGYPVKHAVVQRATNVTTNFLMIVHERLKGTVVPLPPMGDYLETRHRLVAEAILNILDIETRLALFISLSQALAPYISLKSMGTPEAKLSGRLHDFDSVVKPLLQEKSRKFYEDIRETWNWNSRYWEQCALMEVDSGDYSLALKYAETAVGIERHTYTLTTLAKIQYRISKAEYSAAAALRFTNMALDSIDEAIRIGKSRGGRRELIPLIVGVDETCKVLEHLSRNLRVNTLDENIAHRVENYFYLLNQLMRPNDDRYFELKTNWQRVTSKF
jgi:hypothetical protein